MKKKGLFGRNKKEKESRVVPSIVIAKPVEQKEEEYEVVEMEIKPAKIICPDCGGITLEGLDYCDKCGGEITVID